MKKYLENISAIELGKSLEQQSKLTKEEAWEIAHAFSDIDESISELKSDLFPQLIDNSLTNEEFSDLMIDIGEELRHIAYHIAACNYYSYLSVIAPGSDSDWDFLFIEVSINCGVASP